MASRSTFKTFPNQELLEPELKRFWTKLDGNVFAGSPRDELHEAWHKLLENDNILLPRQMIEDRGLHTIMTKDGTHGVVSLSAYHSLHCLKKVRSMMYKDHYHIDKTATAMARELRHAEHCVEYLRESLMCQPDMSLVTFRWINDTAQHPDEPEKFWPTNFDTDVHVCSNWNKVDRWAAERRFDLWSLDLLDRPGSS